MSATNVHVCGRSPTAHLRTRPRWTSPFCTTSDASYSRSDSSRVPTRMTIRIMICSRRRLDSHRSWRLRKVPWGVSESAYNVRDRNQIYQYRGFGVPDLALKRGLNKDLVVAPYATVLAMLIEPRQALRNLTVLESEGALGPYGFRDAIDYTRPLPGSTRAVVGTYMAHHIGMSLVALTNALQRQVWQRRFHADPLVRSNDLVLQERIPRRLVVQRTGNEDEPVPMVPSETAKPAVRETNTAYTPQPAIALLGNVPYTTMITNAGGGYSRYGDI